MLRDFYSSLNYRMLSRNIVDVKFCTKAKMTEFTFIDEDMKEQNTIRYIVTRKEAGYALKWTYEQDKTKSFLNAMRADLKMFIPDLSHETTERIVKDIMDAVTRAPKAFYYIANIKHNWRRGEISPFEEFLFVFFRGCAWWVLSEKEREALPPEKFRLKDY